MSQREVYDCDICREPIHSSYKIADRVYFCVDRIADGAGGMEDVDEHRDMCDSCCVRAFKRLIKLGKRSHEENKYLLSVLAALKETKRM